MRDTEFTVSTVVDDDARFFVELVLWVECAKSFVDFNRTRIKVFFVNCEPSDLIEFVKDAGLEVGFFSTLISESPHCNKIFPHMSDADAGTTVVVDTDLFIVQDLAGFFRSEAVRAAPNNHNNPPPAVFRSILEAAGLGPYRPGLALFRGANGSRESFVNNISAGIVALPKAIRTPFADAWMRWARWLAENRALLGRWSVHVDQVAFALAAEEMELDVEFLPPQVNTVLQMIHDIETPYAFHLTTGHIPQYKIAFRDDRTIITEVFPEATRPFLERLNTKIRVAAEAIKDLPSTKDSFDKFLNPGWRR